MHKGLFIMNRNNEVPKFLEKKFWEWRAGERRTQKEYAKFLGVEPAALSHWINKKRHPDYESCELLSKKMGDGIYVASGYLPPDPDLKKIVYSWEKLDEDARNQISVVVEKSGKPRRVSVFDSEGEASGSKVGSANKEVEHTEPK